MEVKKVLPFLKKYRYAALILLLGIGLMLIPSRGWSQQNEATQPSAIEATHWDITDELTHILGQIQGVGSVKVMLTVSAGEQTVYQEDENITTNENGYTIHKETVILTGTDRGQQALISFVKPPTYLGAIVVCQGADQPAVKLAVLDAVRKITGLGSDQISVVKMK